MSVFSPLEDADVESILNYERERGLYEMIQLTEEEIISIAKSHKWTGDMTHLIYFAKAILQTSAIKHENLLKKASKK